MRRREKRGRRVTDHDKCIIAAGRAARDEAAIAMHLCMVTAKASITSGQARGQSTLSDQWAPQSASKL